MTDVSADALRMISCIPGLRAGFLEAWEDSGLPALKVLAAGYGFQVVPARDGMPKLFRARRVRADDC